MKKLTQKLTALKNTSGQDLIEYVLIAGFLAMTVVATLSGAASGISTIFSEVGSVMPVDSSKLVTVSTN
jgi:Flp pilus assembly pilin Flp